MVLRYDTKVVAVGELASTFFDAGVVVLFGEDAPEELAEYSVIHRPSVADGGVAVGDAITIGGERLEVLAVGDVANANLVNLGHLVLKRNGEHQAALPGDVCCDDGPLPAVEVGDRLTIGSG